LNILIALYLLLAGFGDSPPDLLSFVDAEQYFRSRQIDVSAQHLAQLAEEQPAAAGGQVVQLLAIRWLGDQRVQEARAALTRIAERKILPLDPHGFARDYALHALASLDSKVLRHQRGNRSVLRIEVRRQVRHGGKSHWQGRGAGAALQVPHFQGNRSAVRRPIKWNFTKFLIGRNGDIVARYEPPVKLESATVTKAMNTELVAKE
jgi:hypothetical protein